MENLRVPNKNKEEERREERKRKEKRERGKEREEKGEREKEKKRETTPQQPLRLIKRGGHSLKCQVKSFLISI